MDGSHPNNYDPRPKRRKEKDNPYEIFTVGRNTSQPQYFLVFVDGSGVRQHIESDQTLYEAFDRFELDDLAHLNEVDRHYEQSEQTEGTLHWRAVQPRESVEETVSQQMEVESLYRAIARLPDKQRRRLTLYYFGEFTYEQIAEMEGCTFQAVAKSIDAAGKNLKKFLTEG